VILEVEEGVVQLAVSLPQGLQKVDHGIEHKGIDSRVGSSTFNIKASRSFC